MTGKRFLLHYKLLSISLFLTSTLMFSMQAERQRVHDQSYKKELKWDWNKIDPTAIKLPKQLRIGVGTSALQHEDNCTNTNWSPDSPCIAIFQKKAEEQGKKFIVVGKTCGLDTHYKKYIKDMAQDGFTTFRFSIEMSKVMPEPGKINRKELNRYIDMMRECANHNISALVVLHHYIDPLWLYKLGGFEKVENLKYYIQYCEAVLREISKQIPDEQKHLIKCVTFNSPSRYATKGWLYASTPPFKKDKKLMIEVLKNLLMAHSVVYHRAKEIDQNISIGIVKNIFQLDPKRPGHIDDMVPCQEYKYLFDELIFTYLTTGKFKIDLGQDGIVEFNSPHFQGSELAFICVNHYGHWRGNNGTLEPPEDEPKSDNPAVTLYPEGLYRAMMEVTDRIARPLGIPIIVSESGFATKDPQLKDIFFKRTLYSLHKAIKEGAPVIGYIYWAFKEGGYEFGSPWDYGLYNKEGTGVVKGAHYFMQVVKKHNQQQS